MDTQGALGSYLIYMIKVLPTSRGNPAQSGIYRIYNSLRKFNQTTILIWNLSTTGTILPPSLICLQLRSGTPYIAGLQAPVSYTNNSQVSFNIGQIGNSCQHIDRFPWWLRRPTVPRTTPHRLFCPLSSRGNDIPWRPRTPWPTKSHQMQFRLCLWWCLSNVPAWP